MDKTTMIKNLVVTSAMNTITDEQVVGVGVAVGLVQGMKYQGSVKRGIKAGLATVGVIAGVNAFMSVASNWDEISRH